MHELSIANNIVSIIEDKLKNEEFTKVLTVNVVIGKFSCVSASSLEFCFDVVSKGTILENSRLVINETNAEILCNICNKKSNVNVDNPVFICPYCKSEDVVLEKGEEFYIKNVEVD